MFFKLILAFAPWLLFDILGTGASMERLKIAAAVCFVLAVLVGLKNLRKGLILSWGTLLFFLAMAAFMFSPVNVWVAMHMGVLASGTLTFISWLSLIINKPFTWQMAKQDVPKEVWKQKGFIFHNRIVTLVWCLIFTFNLCTNLLVLYTDILPPWIVQVKLIVVGMIFTLIYVHVVRKRREKAGG